MTRKLTPPSQEHTMASTKNPAPKTGAAAMATGGSPVKTAPVTRKDLGFLQPGLRYEDVVARLGSPSGSGGFGVTMYFYDLADGSKVVFNFGPTENRLQIARLVKPDSSSEDLLRK